MISKLAPSLLALSTLVATPAVAADTSATKTGEAPSAQQKAEPCAHGVAKSLCTRCNPKLAPVFKAKGDWCAEHDRPESQCVLCHPELARKGVK
jgi:hypothetical protein